MRINWKLFEDNSSTAEAAADFGSGEIKTYREWASLCWPKDVKAEIKRIANNLNLAVGQVRKRARRWANRYFQNPYS
jgi:hypothetical protein